MFYDANLSKYLMIFSTSPSMDVIFVDFSQEIVQKWLWKNEEQNLLVCDTRQILLIYRAYFKSP